MCNACVWERVCAREFYHLSVDNWSKSKFNGCTVRRSGGRLYIYVYIYIHIYILFFIFFINDLFTVGSVLLIITLNEL